MPISVVIVSFDVLSVPTYYCFVCVDSVKMRRWAVVVSCLLSLSFPGVVFAQKGEVEVEKARRVVALSSLSADLVASINPDVLIGVPGTSLTNKDPRYSGLKRVSNGRSQPSVELILALNPDLVIGAEGFHSRVLNALNKLGVQTLAVKVNRWDRLEKVSRTLQGRIVNAGSIDSRLSQLCPSKKLSKSSGTSVLILAGVSPKLSPGQQSWSGSLLDRMGLENSTKGLPGSSEFSGYITMSNERLLAIKPEKVLVVNPSGDSAQTVRSLIPFFPGLKADDFKVMDYYGLINPGSLSSIGKACTALSSL